MFVFQINTKASVSFVDTKLDSKVEYVRTNIELHRTDKVFIEECSLSVKNPINGSNNNCRKSNYVKMLTTVEHLNPSEKLMTPPDI